MNLFESKQSDQIFRSAGRKAYHLTGVERHETGDIKYTVDNPYPLGSRENKLWVSGYADAKNVESAKRWPAARNRKDPIQKSNFRRVVAA